MEDYWGRPAGHLSSSTERLGVSESEPEDQQGSKMMLLGGIRRVTLADIKNKITSCQTIQKVFTREFWESPGGKTALVTSCTLGTYYLSGYSLLPFTIPVAAAGSYWVDTTTPKAEDIETANKIRNDIERVKHEALVQSFESIGCLKNEKQWINYLELSLEKKLRNMLVVNHFKSITEVENPMMEKVREINKNLSKRMLKVAVAIGKGDDRSNGLKDIYGGHAQTDLAMVQECINNSKQEKFKQDRDKALEEFMSECPDAKNNAQRKLDVESERDYSALGGSTCFASAPDKGVFDSHSDDGGVRRRDVTS